MESKYFFLLEIGVILLAAHIGGILSKKLKQPAVLGQIIAGMILGLGLMHKTELIEHLSEIGVILLMFIAGLETDVDELKASSRSSSLIAIGGVITPFLMVGGGVYLLTKDINVSLFMGVISTATSVSISVQTLREISQLRTRQGISILGAAIIDDIVGIILLTVLIGLVKPSESAGLLMVLGKIGLFFLITFGIGYAITKVIENYCEEINLEDAIVTYAVVVCFLLAFMSEEFGVAAITGAYFAGVVFSMTRHRHKISHEINKMSSTLFTPIFFVSIGMGVNLKAAMTAALMGSVLIVMGVIGKLVGCGLGARLSGFNKQQSLQIGIGMVPRAEVAIIIANLGMRIGIIGNGELAAVILMVVATTLITPSFLKMSFEEKKEMPVRQTSEEVV